MKDIQIGPLDVKEKTRGQRTVSSIIWLISTARNIIVVVFCAILGYIYQKNGNLPFKLSSNFKQLKFFIILFGCIIVLLFTRLCRIRSPRFQATTVWKQSWQRNVYFRRHGVQIRIRNFSSTASIYFRKHIVSQIFW